MFETFRHLEAAANLEVVTLSESKEIARLDSYLYYGDDESARQAYIKENFSSVWLLTNLWIKVFDRIDREVAWSVNVLISKQGLIKTIKAAQEYADCFLRHKDYPSTCPIFTYFCTTTKASSWEILQALRFPKRYSPSKVDSLIEESLNEFYEVNLKVLNEWTGHRRVPSWLLAALRHHIAKLFKGWSAPPADSISAFSSGSTLGNTRDIDCKINNLALCSSLMYDSQADSGLMSHTLVPLFDVNTRLDSVPAALYKECTQLQNYNVVEAVPKNFKSRRIIAKEAAARQYKASILDDSVRRQILVGSRDKNGFLEINLADQTQNQELCRIGSQRGDFATIDLSHASDCVAWNLVCQVFPDQWVSECVSKELRAPYLLMPNRRPRLLTGDALRRNRQEGKLPSYISADANHAWVGHLGMDSTGAKHKVKAGMAFTAGNPLTFSTQSILFWAVAHVAKDLATGFGVTLDHLPANVPNISVYGDDIIVPTVYAETVIDLLTILGFSVNTDKSFYDTNLLFRESCGVEFFEGLPLHSEYWPRKTIKLDTSVTKKARVVYNHVVPGPNSSKSLEILVSMQHRLFDWREMRLFLDNVINIIKPSITSHYPYTDCADLWGLLPPSIYTGYAPIDWQGFGDRYGCYSPDQVNVLSPELREAITRERHLAPISKTVPHSDSKDTVTRTCNCPSCQLHRLLGPVATDVRLENLDKLRYVTFLKNGPTYETKLDELLGITMRPQVFTGKEVKTIWTTVLE